MFIHSPNSNQCIALHRYRSSTSTLHLLIELTQFDLRSPSRPLVSQPPPPPASSRRLLHLPAPPTYLLRPPSSALTCSSSARLPGRRLFTRLTFSWILSTFVCLWAAKQRLTCDPFECDRLQPSSLLHNQPTIQVRPRSTQIAGFWRRFRGRARCTSRRRWWCWRS